MGNAGEQGNGYSQWAHISGDGKRIIFGSYATNFVAPATRSYTFDTYLRDLNTNTTTLINVTPSGQQGSGTAGGADINEDGNLVVFTSNSTDLVPGVSLSGTAAFVRNLQANTTTLVSLDSDGSPFVASSGGVSGASMSQDGRFVLFQAVLQAAHGYVVYWHDTFPAIPSAPSLTPTSPTPTSQSPVLSWDAVSGATSYNIYRNGALLGSTPDATYTDTTAPEGNNSYYVTAANGVGESVPSNTVAVLVDHTAPILGAPTWTSNPVILGSDTSFTVPATEDTTNTPDVSGIAGGEYFIGADPGVGSATALSWNGTDLGSNPFGANLQPGVYNIGIRTVDAAGNWSSTTTVYLVVFDPSGPGYIVGRQNLTPTSSDVLPWISTSNKDFATFGFNVKFAANGTVDPASSFSFNYDEKGGCGTSNRPACHTFDLSATSFDWFGVGGTGNAQGIFQGTATLTIDSVTQTVLFRVEAVDGGKLDPVQTDSFVLKIYSQGSDPQTAVPLYQVNADFASGTGNAHGGVQVKG